MSSEWMPDIVVDARDSFGHGVDVFLDGVQVQRCFQARVKWESFDGPVFGELIIDADVPGRTAPSSLSSISAAFRKPRLGEFERDGMWCRFVCGRVYLKIDESRKKVLAQIRAAESR